MRQVCAIAVVCGLTAVASADDEFGNGAVIFARADRLVRLQLKTKTEVELASLGHKLVRSLATDPAGKLLLANLEGTWHWMPLDGSTNALTELPCAEGPATVTQDGDSVVCRAKTTGVATAIVNLRSNTTVKVDVGNGRIVGTGAGRKLVWADKTGVWAAPPTNRKAAKKLALESPKRGFLASPDGTRAMGTYDDEVYVDVHHKKPAEVLMSFALDGEGARRKAIRSGVPLEWSHDSQWVLIQDAGRACLVHATGGEYKCWSGYTGVSISPDGKNLLLLGKRDRSEHGSGRATRSRRSAVRAPSPAPEETMEGEDTGGTAVAAPSGPMSLYRGKLEGSAFTESPSLIAKIADGAAVWVPARDKPESPQRTAAGSQSVDRR